MSYSVKAIEDELFKSDVAILAAEDWAPQYSKDPKTHAALLRLEASMMRVLRRYFKNISDDAPSFINKPAYIYALEEVKSAEVKAADNFSVQAIVENADLGSYDGTFIKVMFEEIAVGVFTGAKSGESIYSKYRGIEKTDAFIQRYAMERAAYLVGKRLGKDGVVVDNPKAEYRVTDKIRDDIRSSIKTSLSLRENHEEAVFRLKDVIKSPKRAELIAQTEAVNSFQGGILQFGKQTGAVGKESQALDSDDQCADYEAEGIVELDYLYGGED
ncbi:MAG TPA: hypothetical protein VGB67_05020, partial [Fibrella sp.]